MLIAGTSASTGGDEVVVMKGQAPAPSGMNDPAARFARVYTNEVFALMGATSLSYRTGEMDQVKLRFNSYEFAKLADGILKDTVLGARLVFTDGDGNPFDMSQPVPDWVTYPTNYARAVAALPGVTSYRWFGDRSFLFTTDSIESRVKLQQLVERKFDASLTGYWKGECFGPGCKPDPAPPTGEV